MKYILMMNAPVSGVEGYQKWSQADMQTHFAALQEITHRLKESGEFIATEGLVPPQFAKVVRSGTNGAPITDGVFPEGKEFLLGYWMVDVDSAERAYDIAGQISSCPGPGGIPTNMPIEVRQIMTSKAVEQV